jgi:hypothetical protein
MKLQVGAAAVHCSRSAAGHLGPTDEPYSEPVGGTRLRHMARHELRCDDGGAVMTLALKGIDDQPAICASTRCGTC